jgi:dTDP-4-amino-4,6-dideoxygalactose transaminase
VPFFGQNADGLANTERAAERTLNLPLHQSLSDDDVARVIEAVRTFGTEHGL